MLGTLIDNTEKFVSKLSIKRISLKTMLLTTFEKVTLVIIVIALIFMMSIVVFTRSQVNSVNASIEVVKAQTNEKALENQILQQKVDDLMTSERISQIAKKYGLKYNEANIKSVSK